MFGTRMFGTTLFGSLGAIFALANACRLTVVEWEDRTDEIDQESRFEVVPRENRVKQLTRCGN